MTTPEDVVRDLIDHLTKEVNEKLDEVENKIAPLKDQKSMLELSLSRLGHARRELKVSE